MRRKETKKDSGAQRFNVDQLERNTLTMSLVVVLLGLFCLPNVEKGGSTWIVLMMVFALNAALLLWIIIRILRRRKKEK